MLMRPSCIGLELVALLRKSSASVLSGFYEIALTPALRATLRHVTSQNPRDSQGDAIMISRA